MKKFYTSKTIFALFLLLNIAATAPAQQGNTNYKITTWNAEWLSCSTEDFGPSDEHLQVQNVATVIAALNPDIIALQEIGTSNTYATVDTLVRLLGEGWGGSIVPWNASNCSQNQAIIYKTAKVQVAAAQLLTGGGSSYNWSSGRFPALYNVNFLTNDGAVPVSFVNIHAKAMSDASSYTRRVAASQGLKTLLDSEAYRNKRIVLIGDFNDYLIGTQCNEYTESPYKNFMDDTPNYKGLTQNLQDSYYNNPLIDNIVISNELFDAYVANSVTRENSVTQYVNDYYNSTSDHIPVSVTLRIGAVAGESDCSVHYAENFAASLGDFTPYSVAGERTWYHNGSYGAYISGYSGGNTANEDWLISPPFDLQNHLSAQLSFEHALNYCATQYIESSASLWMSNDYVAGTSPATTNWTQVAIPAMPSGSDWTYVGSGAIAVPATLLHDNFRFAFKYTSNSAVAATWEIKNLTFDTECWQQSHIADLVPQPATVVIGGERKIVVSGAADIPVAVFDLLGRRIFSTLSNGSIEISLGSAGIYIVRTGAETHKVAVW